MSGPDTVTSDARPERLRRRVRWLALGIALAMVLAGCTTLVLYARGGGPVPDALGFLRPKGSDPLAPSDAAETVLRTLRLAGFDQAVVGEQGGVVVVRVAIPEVRDARTVELSWQTALEAGAQAYPDSSDVVAQLFAPDDTPLLEVRAASGDIRASARDDDSPELHERLRFRYLSSSGGSQ